MPILDLNEAERQLTQRRLDIEKLQLDLASLRVSVLKQLQDIQAASGTGPSAGNPDAAVSGGSVIHSLKHLFRQVVSLGWLTASRPLKLNASKEIISDKIDLASSDDITGVLGTSNGGTGGGVTGVISLTVHTATIQYKDWGGSNASITVVDGVSLTGNAFTNGVRTT